MSLARVFATVLLFAAPSACNSSEFAGSTQKATVTPKEKAKPEPGDAKKQDAKPEKAPKLPQNPEPAKLGQPTPGAPSPASPSLDVPPTPGIDSGQGPGNGSPLVDVLSTLLGGPAVDAAQLGMQPDDNNVIFGDQKTFHIGDGQMTQSSCLTGISPYPIAGKQYLFEFEVLADGQVAVDIGFICGVDYSDTNLVYIAKNGQPVSQALPLPVGASSFQIPATPLTKGVYQIGIESRTGTADPEGNPADADDYVLGKVHIQSKGAKIKIGKVYLN